MCIHYNTTDPVWVESQEISVKDQKKLCVRKLITVIFIIVKTLEKTKDDDNDKEENEEMSFSSMISFQMKLRLYS